MDYYDVYAILGKPDSDTGAGSSSRNCLWVLSNDDTLIVQFIYGTVYQIFYNSQPIPIGNDIKSKEETEIINNKNNTDIDRNIEQISKVKLDINKFIKELATEKSIDGSYGATNYRFNNGFYNKDLSLEKFKVLAQDNNTTYLIDSTQHDTYSNAKYSLKVVIDEQEYLKEITIEYENKDNSIHYIKRCAEEVEDALSYALYDTRKNNRGIDVAVKELEIKNYISGNEIINTNCNIEKNDSVNSRKISFEINENLLTYKISY